MAECSRRVGGHFRGCLLGGAAPPTLGASRRHPRGRLRRPPWGAPATPKTAPQALLERCSEHSPARAASERCNNSERVSSCAHPPPPSVRMALSLPPACATERVNVPLWPRPRGHSRALLAGATAHVTWMSRALPETPPRDLASSCALGVWGSGQNGNRSLDVWHPGVCYSTAVRRPTRMSAAVSEAARAEESQLIFSSNGHRSRGRAGHR